MTEPVLRVGLVGVDGHATSFTPAFNGSVDGTSAGVPSARVTSVWAPERGDAERFADVHRIADVVSAPTDMIDSVDLAVIVYDADGGESRVDMASPFLRAGIATFVARPLATSLEAAAEVCAISREYGAPLLTASPLRYAAEIVGARHHMRRATNARSIVASGPGPWWFYAYHVIEMYLALVGPGVQSINCVHRDERDIAVVRHAAGHCAVIQVLRDVEELDYRITIHADSGITTRVLTDHHEHWHDAGPFAWGTRMMTVAAEMARSRIMPLPYSEMIEPWAVLAAGTASAERGVEVAVQGVLA